MSRWISPVLPGCGITTSEAIINFAVDRAAAEAALAVLPDLRLVTQANRAFLRRAVKFLVGEGIDQFLDLGSGIPTVENVHEVAQQFNSRAEFAAFFDGLEFVEPGLVWVPLWRPDSPDALLLDQPSESRTLGGVGRKP
jgi:hypothetical protein